MVIDGKVNALMMVEGMIKSMVVIKDRVVGMIKDMVVIKEVLITGASITRCKRRKRRKRRDMIVVIINGAIKAWSTAPPPIGGQTPTSQVRHHPMGGPGPRNGCQHLEWKSG